MCGIAGIVGGRCADPEAIGRMLHALRHRGPDDTDVHAARGATLGQRRLSIIDLAGGRQPIGNEDGTRWIVCNGEIYNYRELMAELEAKGHRFSTRSDSEVILHLYEELGEACLGRLRGMFAFAIWDEGEQRLFAARDHLGQKPFYYRQDGGELAFASEIKGLLPLLPGGPEVEPAALHQYLSLRIVAPPLSMFRGIQKLPPAHCLTFSAPRRPEGPPLLGPLLRAEAQGLGGGADRRARAAADRGRAAPHRERRPGRRLPERRPRLDPGRGDADEARGARPGADLHHRRALRRLRRGALRPHGGRALRHGAPRGDGRPLAHRQPAGPRLLPGRALGPALGLHLPREPDGAAAREGGAGRRRRRRAVRRLRPLLRQPLRRLLRPPAARRAPRRHQPAARPDPGRRLVQEQEPPGEVAPPRLVPDRRRALRPDAGLLLLPARAPGRALRAGAAPGRRLLRRLRADRRGLRAGAGRPPGRPHALRRQPDPAARPLGDDPRPDLDGARARGPQPVHGPQGRRVLRRACRPS